MKIRNSSVAFWLIAFVSLSAGATDRVKSLQFGTAYGERELARLFPGATCRPHGQSGQSLCALPTTFLGRPTIAELFRDKEERLIDFTAYLPAADETDVTRVLATRFGQPEHDQRGSGVVTVWRQAGSPTLKVESGITNGELRINFYSRALAATGSSALDPNDL
jgi:hypothetical protein